MLTYLILTQNITFAFLGLIESSHDLSDEAINDLLNALGTLSLSSLANAAATENFNSEADLPTKKKEKENRPQVLYGS